MIQMALSLVVGVDRRRRHKRMVRHLIEENPIANDIGPEALPFGESLVHITKGVDDDIDRAMDSWIPRKLVLGRASVVGDVGRTLVADDD